MNLNQFLPFAEGVGANVDDQATFAGAAYRQTGFQNGVALPAQANKVWRQASFMAAMIGQFIADYAAQDALDDGNVSALEAKFIGAITAVIQSIFGPVSVHMALTDTGSANSIVANTTPAFATYTAPSIVIFKKGGAANSGACIVNFNGIGSVGLKDNTGADFANGALIANSIYMAFFDGAVYHVLGGSATYTNVSNLTANSGKGIAVQGSGEVDISMALNTTHSASPSSSDIVIRQNSGGAILNMTWAEELSAIAASLPQSGPGVGIGQFVPQTVQISGPHSPTYAGFTKGMTASGSQVAGNTWPGVDTSKLWAWNGINEAGHGTWASLTDSPNGINGTLAGTWQLAGWAMTYVDLIYYSPVIILFWVRIV